ncbi:MAG TPA: response regulator [Cyclobacteriaceae bacterium]|nr:response regulator [Cyclobacteriaceae bacterium]
MNIFLIEDDKIYSDFISKTLSRDLNYKVQAFYSAEDALTAIGGNLPDVMIIDYKLPGMSGIELFEKLKSKVTDSTKVIMLSALDDGNMVLSFIQKGVRDYVIKDENVIDSLQSILEGKDDESYLFN